MVSYSDRLKDPRWQRRRLEVLNRENFTCETCAATDKTLHVHHKLYRKGAMPWEYEDHELEVLCKDCHESEHNTKEALAREMAEMSLWQLDQLLGYAISLRVDRAWESDDVTKLEPVHVANAEQAEGLADGLRLEHPYNEEVNTPDPLPITDLIRLAADAVVRRRTREC